MKPADKKDKLIASLAMVVISLTLVIFLLIILLLISYFYQPYTSRNEPTQGLCGNALVWNSHVDEPLYGEGEKLFKQNCAVCHSLGSNYITGPGLSGILNRVPNEEWAIQYILNNDKMLKMCDPYSMKLRKDFPNDRMIVFEGILQEEQIKKIRIYLRAAPPVIVP
jgi:cytochrome c2